MSTTLSDTLAAVYVQVVVDPDIQSPELLQQLFARGTRLLLDQLPAVWAGQGPSMARAQDDNAMTHAPKVCSVFLGIKQICMSSRSAGCGPIVPHERTLICRP